MHNSELPVRGKRWVFTLNNYTQEDIEKLLNPNDVVKAALDYLIFGKEKAPTTGTLHLQGYIRLNSRIHRQSFINMYPPLNKAYVDLARGSEYDNIKYCKKEGDFIEKGQPIASAQKASVADQYVKIIEEIKKVSNNVFLGEEINPDYAKDEMPIYGTHMPDLAVQPRSTEEVAAVMKICYENNIPVTPRGAGTGLAGGAVPLYGGVLIDISKMNKIKSYDMENFVVEIEAGVLLNDLAEDCQSKGMLYPPDPGEKFACVGGNVATNAGGKSAV